MVGRINHSYARAALITLILLFTVVSVFRSTDDRAHARDDGTRARIGASERTPGVFFEENRGQFDPKVRYQARGTDGHALFLTDKDAAYVVVNGPQEAKEGSAAIGKPIGAAVFLRFEGASPGARSSGHQELSHRTNHFSGSDPEKWVTEVPNYAVVKTPDLYSGVDLEWSATEEGRAGITLTADKESDLQEVSILIEGAESAELANDGGLVVNTAAGPISIPAPKVSFGHELAQRAADASFVLRDTSSSDSLKGRVFRLGIGKQKPTGEKQAERPARADRPSLSGSLTNLAYSTFLGGSALELRDQQDIAVDHLGQAVVAGQTNSADFPTTPGSFDPTRDAIHAMMVAKFNAAGSALIYSTFIEGDGGMRVEALAIDSAGNAYLTGCTGFVTDPPTGNFPTTGGAFDTTYNGGPCDAFVTKLNPSGSALVFSTFIGSSTEDNAFSIDVDASGNSYITGFTGGPSDFPVVPGSFQTVANGQTACFVTRLNAAGDDLDWSGFLGGSGACHARGIAVDTAGQAHVTGFTFSNATVPFPTTTGAFDETENGREDAFAVKINSVGTDFVYSTMLGGAQDDRGSEVKVNATGDAYYVGTAEWSTTPFPSTPGTYQDTPLGLDTYLVRLSPDGSSMDFGTFYGFNGGAVYTTDLAIAADGSIFIAGHTDGAGLPVTANAYDQTFNGDHDAFIAEFSPDATSLEYATYIGGDNWDWGWGIDIDPDENVYLFGYVENGTIDYPTTPGAFDTTINSTGIRIGDYVLTKFGKRLIVSIYVPFDFDGDGKSDISVFRPLPSSPIAGGPLVGSTSQWWLLNSIDISSLGITFGGPDDLPVPADFTGDGKSDVAFYRPSDATWFVLRSEDMTFFAFPFGAPGDVAAPGDYDGDDQADPAVYRPSEGNWYILRSSDSGVSVFPFGVPEDKPIVADFDGDGFDDPGVYRPSVNQWWLLRSTDGVIGYQVGATGDRSVIGDYTGDGRADVAFYRQSTSEWFVIRSEDSSFFAFPWGVAGDIPVAGDYDGDGVMDPAVFRPSEGTWFILRSTEGFQAVQFGVAGDVPLQSVVSVQ
ncbi:MAG: VCBS repeat-containing protein [Aridibacter famidurans]|nr:VCBS repeat-containing protein [Aridibacter famidurans]